MLPTPRRIVAGVLFINFMRKHTHIQFTTSVAGMPVAYMCVRVCVCVCACMRVCAALLFLQFYICLFTCNAYDF